MKTANEQLIHDFVTQTGQFQDMATLEYVDPGDIRSMKFHLKAADDLFEESKRVESESERLRLRRLSRQHFSAVNELLRRYGRQDDNFQLEEASDDELAERLFQLIQ